MSLDTAIMISFISRLDSPPSHLHLLHQFDRDVDEIYINVLESPGYRMHNATSAALVDILPKLENTFFKSISPAFKDL